MSSEPDVTFLSVEDVLHIHENTLQHEGGARGLRDQGLLDSAVAMPQQRFGGELLHEDLASMAAAYLFHLAQNHPFEDGNKRVAALAALVFLQSNGVESLPEPDALENATLAVAAGKLPKPELTAWMKTQV